MYHTGTKINILSKNSHVQNYINQKIHIFKNAFLAKSTFFTKITFQKQIFHITQISNSSEFMDKMCDLALVCVCTDSFLVQIAVIRTHQQFLESLPKYIFRTLSQSSESTIEYQCRSCFYEFFSRPIDFRVCLCNKKAKVRQIRDTVSCSPKRVPISAGKYGQDLCYIAVSQPFQSCYYASSSKSLFLK